MEMIGLMRDEKVLALEGVPKEARSFVPDHGRGKFRGRGGSLMGRSHFRSTPMAVAGINIRN